MSSYNEPLDVITLGVRACDEKPLPPARRDEWIGNPRSRKLGKAGDPVVVSRELFHLVHSYFQGRTRCGKTATGLLPLYDQCLHPFTEEWNSPDGKTHSRLSYSTLVVLDPKASPGFMHSCRRKAEAAGRPFYCISLTPEYSWYVNLLSQFRGDSVDAQRAGTGLLTALQMDLGSGYGAHYFTVQTLALLFQVCDHLSGLHKKGKAPTIKEAIRYIKQNSRANPRDSDSLASTLALLAAFPQFDPPESEQHVVDMRKVIEERGVVFVSADCMNQGPVARLVLGLMMYLTLAAATAIASEQDGDPSPLPHTLLIADEAHNLVNRSTRDITTAAAESRLTFALACQTSENLKEKQLDLYPTIRGNCSIKVFHSAYGPDVDELLSYSCETIRPLATRKLSSDVRFYGRQALAPDSESDRVERLLTPRGIQSISATTNQALVVLDTGEGFIEPIPTNTLYAETAEEHQASKSAPWPLAPRSKRQGPVSTNGGAVAKQSPLWLAAHLSELKSKIHQDRLLRIARLLQAVRSESVLETPE